MKLAKREFAQAATQLKDKFVNCNNPDYYLKRAHNNNSNNSNNSSSKTVPLDGFGLYACSVWDTIKQAKELSLPSQKEMLATYRCDEVCFGVFMMLCVYDVLCVMSTRKRGEQ